MTRPALPLLLAANGGYVDTVSYLALHGLFATHVTGNFVTLGAALVLGSSGVVAKLLALPVFCVVVWSTRLLAGRQPLSHTALRAILSTKIVLLAAGAACALSFGPFESGDGWRPLATGMLLVAAMAIQNALHRIHLSQLPPTTIMTGNTTQFMVDLADLLRSLPAAERDTIRTRLRRLGIGILTFAAGCALGAWLYASGGMVCFLLPPLLALATLFVAQGENP